jgi:hypothetical protein
VRRLNGQEETEEAGGYRQRHAGQDEAEEENLAGEIERRLQLLSALLINTDAQ